jgi:hypothetical protein
VRVVHSLQRDAGVIAIEVAILDKVLDGFDDLSILVGSLTGLMVIYIYLLEGVCLVKTCFQHCSVVSAYQSSGEIQHTVEDFVSNVI